MDRYQDVTFGTQIWLWTLRVDYGVPSEVKKGKRIKVVTLWAERNRSDGVTHYAGVGVRSDPTREVGKTGEVTRGSRSRRRVTNVRLQVRPDGTVVETRWVLREEWGKSPSMGHLPVRWLWE